MVRNRKIIVMGVAGSGKSSVGAALGAAMGAPYLDGDDLHSAENIAKMSAGIALTDDDRWPWLTKIGETLTGHPGTILIGCSALKRTYRDLIRKTAERPVTFIHCAGSRSLIAERMAKRPGHFMPMSLLDSQFAALELPGADEDAITLNIAAPLLDLVAKAMTQLLEDRT
ncbi:gluconokinase [Rhizobium glycinendophyticum]|nr:gluconokinase [Rhizobium glycinendophyticum]